MDFTKVKSCRFCPFSGGAGAQLLPQLPRICVLGQDGVYKNVKTFVAQDVVPSWCELRKKPVEVSLVLDVTDPIT